MLAYVGIKCNALRISSRLTFDEAIRFASIRAIYVDRKPSTTIYIINGRPRVISEMGSDNIDDDDYAYRRGASSLAFMCLFY